MYGDVDCTRVPRFFVTHICPPFWPSHPQKQLILTICMLIGSFHQIQKTCQFSGQNIGLITQRSVVQVDHMSIQDNIAEWLLRGPAKLVSSDSQLQIPELSIIYFFLFCLSTARENLNALGSFFYASLVLWGGFWEESHKRDIPTARQPPSKCEHTYLTAACTC